jgi:radical SAM protein with 4Fe4S-binding SPASM domain
MNHLSFIQLYPTLRCNQSCSFCFNQNISYSASHEDISEKAAHALIEILLKEGIREIDILGGEPMLLAWMKDFVEYVTELDIQLNISTNGSLPDTVFQYAAIKSPLMNIGFSIHGLPQTHNTLTMSDNFSKTITCIKQMISKGKNPIVKSTLNQKNKNEIFDLVLYLRDMGIKRYYLLHEDIIGRDQYSGCISFPEFYTFFSELKQYLNGILDIGFVAASGFYKYGPRKGIRCSAGITKIALLPDGSAFPCNLFMGFNDFYLGNIYQDGIESILKNPILGRFKKYDGNRCPNLSCSHYAMCSGGCPAHIFSVYGSLDAADPRCKLSTQ